MTKAILESITVSGRTLRKGTAITLNFDGSAKGDLHETVESIYMDGTTDCFGTPVIIIETSTWFGAFHRRQLDQIEEALR